MLSSSLDTPNRRVLRQHFAPVYTGIGPEGKIRNHHKERLEDGSPADKKLSDQEVCELAQS
jgi:hypothetical protein